MKNTGGVPENFSLEGLIAAHMKVNTHKQYTSGPAIVLRVYGAGEKQMVDIQPVVSRILSSGLPEDQPPISGVPVIFPGSLTSQFSFPINVGDTVLAVFCGSDIENFKIGDGRPLGAKTARKQSMMDAVAIPGLFPFSKARNNPALRNLPHNTMDAVIVHNIGTSGECEIRLKENGDVKVTTPALFEVQCKDMKVVASNSISLKAATMAVDVPVSTWTGALTQVGNYTQTGAYVLTGNYTQTGIYMLGGKNINSHVHTGVTSGPSNTGGIA
jgi:hypothetical protein